MTDLDEVGVLVVLVEPVHQGTHLPAAQLKAGHLGRGGIEAAFPTRKHRPRS